MTCPTCGCGCGEQRTQARYHLDAPQVARIRAAIRKGKTDREIADQFGVGHMTVFNIRTRRTWSTA